MTGIRCETQKTSLIEPCSIVPYLLLRRYYVLFRKQKEGATGKPGYRNFASKSWHSDSHHSKNFLEQSKISIHQETLYRVCRMKAVQWPLLQPERGIFYCCPWIFFSPPLSEFHCKLFPLRLCSTDIFPPLGRDEPIL